MNYYRLSEFYKRDVSFSFSEENKYEKAALENATPFVGDEMLLFTVDKLDSYLTSYDLLPTIGPPLVSARWKEMVGQVAPGDCEFIPAKIIADNGEINDQFYAMNILHAVACLDRDRSEVRPLIRSMPDGPLKIISLSLNTAALAGHQLVRMAEAKPFIIVSEAIVEAYKSQQLKGAQFVKEGNQQQPEFVDV